MALFDEADTNELKKWIVQRLEDVSDADADVLADYVLALLRHDQDEAQVKQMCTDQLADFLQDNTSQFVDDVFTAIKTKGYLPGGPPAAAAAVAPASNLLASNPIFASASSGSTLSAAAAPYVPRSPGRSPAWNRERSRSPEDHDMNNDRRSYGRREREPLTMDRDSHDQGYGGRGDYRSNRRGGRGGRNPDDSGGWRGRGGNDRGRGWRGNQGHQQPPRGQQQGGPGFGQQQQNLGGMPGMPGMPAMPGMPWGQDPMSQFLAVQAAAAAAAAGWQPSQGGFPGAPMAVPPGSPPNRKVPKKWGERCKDYDTKGYCAQGDMCPYEHGGSANPFAAQGQQGDDEYDPNNSLLLPQLLAQHQGQGQGQGQSPGQDQGRGGGRGGRGYRGQGRGQRGGRGNRSEFSSTKNHERRNVPLVVENIPDEKLNEASIKEFFGQFGTVESVAFKPYRNIATIKFQSFQMAKAAFESPAPIFDNRFVKVFWQRQDSGMEGADAQGGTQAGGSGGGDDMEIDEAEFARKQEEAQKAYEEKQAKKKANEERAKDLEKRKEELLKMQQEQKRMLLEKLAKKHAEIGAVSTEESDEANGGSKTDAEAKKTAALKAQLEALEAEAASLGIDHSKLDQPLTDYSSFRGRGGYRGRGTYPPRGAYPPYRATRGGFGFTRGRVMNKLDNRTKKVIVGGADHSKDEELRQYLLLNYEFESIEPHPAGNETQIISFKDRATAEKFFYTGSEIPNVGKVELSWYNAPSSATGSGVNSPAPTPGKEDKSGDVEMGGSGDTAMGNAASGMDEYDVAEDDEGRWAS